MRPSPQGVSARYLLSSAEMRTKAFCPVWRKGICGFSCERACHFGENTEDFLKLYKVTEENFQRACLDAQRDYGFLNIQRVLSRLSKVHPCPVYQYYFVEPIVLGDGTFVGATHSAELFYVFHTLSVMGGQYAGRGSR